MAYDPPLQRALQDPAQQLLLLEHRLQLRHLHTTTPTVFIISSAATDRASIDH